MLYKDIVHTVAQRLDLPVQIVSRTYSSYWRAVREHIQSLPLKEELTDDEFLRLQPNVNIPSIGKLYVTLDRYKRIKKQYHIVEELKNKKKDNDDKDYKD